MNEFFLHKKLEERAAVNALRTLKINDGLVDFCSNDYLGLAKKNKIAPHLTHGSTGSRLLAGNYVLIEHAEKKIAAFHEATAALIFNSGYDANIGLLSCVPQKGDCILYDELSHASIRDGIRLSFARSFSFRHNNVSDLEKKLQSASGEIFVVTESVFSMDGDIAPLEQVVFLCKKYKANLIVDEAHAIGVVGNRGEGVCQHLQLHTNCFARVYTYGKAPGVHGAAITGSKALIQYLINFCRSFIYTTALPPASVAAIINAYENFAVMQPQRLHLQALGNLFQQTIMKYEKLPSITPIQAVIVPGNEEVKKIAETVQQHGFDVRPILYPTVQKGSERLRIILHAFNSETELKDLLNLLQTV
jgi:8-amino-7-oxononanoate synthase